MQRKICMLGAFGVGKTSLVQRFVTSRFSDKYQTTVGVKIDKKQISLDGREITLMLWDMAGQDAVTQVRMSHLRGADGYILVADGTREKTLSIALELHEQALHTVGRPLPSVLCINKSDMRKDWAILQSNLDMMATAGRKLFFCSAKTGEGVEGFFTALASDTLPGESAV